MIKIQVTEQGVIIPKKYFPNVNEVEILLTENGIFVKAKKIENNQNWSQELMDFQGITDSIDFVSYRDELESPREDIF